MAACLIYVMETETSIYDAQILKRSNTLLLM